MKKRSALGFAKFRVAIERQPDDILFEMITPESAPHPPRRVLGVEGGGTKTEWALLDEEGGELGGGALPAANLRLISDEDLLSLLGVLPAEATHVGVFLAGCADAADRRRLERLVQRVWPAAVVAVGGDRESGFATAFGDGDGITVIAGTGSAVTGRVAGRIAKAGGWGHLLGDAGSGYQLAMTALRYVLSNYDLSRETGQLGQAILRKLGLNRLEDLVAWAANADKMSVAKLAPVVFQAAAAGHQEMIAAVQSGAHVLADYTRAVARRLESEAPEVRLLGGLFQHHSEYAEFYIDYIADLLPGAHVAVCAKSGALGAAWLVGRTMPEPLAIGSPVEEADAAEIAVAVTEQRNPRSAQMDKLATPVLVDLFICEEDEVARALNGARDALAAAVDMVAEAMLAGGRLFYTGAGTSGRLGVLDASEIPPTFGASPELVQGIIAGGVSALHSAAERAEDQPQAGELALLGRGVRAGDVVCGIAASGRTPFVLGTLRRAKALGARTILLTCNPARKRDTQWDVEIVLATGPELVTGSTRLKAGTATKVALNILSTCAMVRLGKVRGNLMIDVQASNAKLRDRALRLVCELCGCSRDEARARLEAAGWSVRRALGDR
jgi:N-acetylmuramic acid 6-phosphate etherase